MLSHSVLASEFFRKVKWLYHLLFFQEMSREYKNCRFLSSVSIENVAKRHCIYKDGGIRNHDSNIVFVLTMYYSRCLVWQILSGLYILNRRKRFNYAFLFRAMSDNDCRQGLRGHLGTCEAFSGNGIYSRCNGRYI
jgi:hypothetical protein